MRPVRLAAALFEYDLGLIRAGNAPAAQAHLPPRRNAARGRKDVVPAIALVHLRAFNRRVLLRAVVEQVVVAERRFAVGRNRENPQRISLAADPQPGATYIGTSSGRRGGCKCENRRTGL